MSSFYDPITQAITKIHGAIGARASAQKEVQQPPQPVRSRIPSVHERNETILLNLKKVLAQDKRVLTQHPILKHLVARYDAVLNHVTDFGNPQAPVEPVEMLKDRLSELTVQIANKQHVRNKKQRRRQETKVNEKTARDRGRQYYDRKSNKSKQNHAHPN